MTSQLHSIPATAARTRVQRGSTPGMEWEMWRRTPLPALRSAVIELWAGYEPGSHARHRVLPNGEVSLMLQIGAAQRLIEHDGAKHDAVLSGAFVSGLQERPGTFESLAPMSVVSARLTPLGAFIVLGGVPQAELAQRVLQVDDVLESIPSGHDAYLLKHVIHDWDDTDAARILKVCRKAMPAHATLLIVEGVYPEQVTASQQVQRATFNDVNMLVNTGGRQRSEAEFRQLLAAASFTLTRIVPTQGAVCLVEAKPS